MVTSNGNLNNLVDTQKRPRKSWREVLDQSAPLLLPVAHDALTARVIEQAGYPAYQIGGFALSGRGSPTPTSTWRSSGRTAR